MRVCARNAFLPEAHREPGEAFLDSPVRLDALDFNVSAPHMHATCLVRGRAYSVTLHASHMPCALLSPQSAPSLLNASDQLPYWALFWRIFMRMPLVWCAAESTALCDLHTNCRLWRLRPEACTTGMASKKLRTGRLPSLGLQLDGY
jgi:hypothetical protein